VVWYTGQFYALFFLTQTLKLDGTTSNMLIAVALAIGTPFFIFFGWLSDKIGRKPIILAGCLLAADLLPAVQGADKRGEPGAGNAAIEKSPVTVIADPERVLVPVQPDRHAKFTTSCDIAKSFLARNAVNYGNEAPRRARRRRIKIGDKVITSFDKAKAGAEGAPRRRRSTPRRPRPSAPPDIRPRPTRSKST
jgi:hypothetical protein